MTDLEFILEVQKLLQKIKSEHDLLIKDYPKNDARVVLYSITGNVIHSLFLHLLAVDDTFTWPSWWKKRFGKDILEDNDLAAIKDSAILTKHSYFVFFLSKIETIMRKVSNLVLPGFNSNGRQKFSALYLKYFETLNLLQYVELYNIANYLRNTIHTNGIFISYNSQDLTCKYKGKEFIFKHQKPIDFISQENFLFLIDELYLSVKDIVSSTEFKKHEFIEDKFY